MSNLRTLVWAYLLLLIFEGALRKWIVPGLDAPLLVVRDPLVVWIYYEAYRNRLSFSNAFFIPNLVLAVITAILATLFGDGNVVITIYGIHADYLQIPFIFLIPQILNRNDVITMGRFLLYLSIPMAALIIYQFRSPQGSLINKGALNTWYGTVRPSGTFSFISGPVGFFPLVSSFLFLGFLQPRTYSVWLMSLVTFALFLVAACSGSRSIIVATGIVVVAAILCVLMRRKGGMGMLVAAVVLAIVLPILSTLSVFQEGTKQLTQRFADGAANGEDANGFADRYANTMLGPLQAMGSAPIFGNGLGLGTNAAAGMLTGTREFLGSEDEWGRLIFECGPIFGFLLVVFRIALTVAVARSAYNALMRDNPLPILIFAACGLLVLNGQWGVPTSEGFAIFGAGLTLAACVEPEEDEDYEDEHSHADDESDHSTAADTVA